jgi:hypothetical protein
MIRIRIRNRRGPGGNPGVFFRAVALVSAAWLAVSCIERSNPFDPLNSGDGAVASIKKGLQPQLDVLTAGEAVYAALLAGFAEAFRKDSLDNSVIAAANAKRRADNLAIEQGNAGTVAKNLVSVADSLVALQYFSILDTLKPYQAGPDFAIKRSDLQARAANLSTFMAQANAEHAPASIYPRQFSDSVLYPFVRDEAEFTRLRARFDSDSAAITDSNLQVAAYNLDKRKANTVIKGYNDSIDYLKQAHNKPILVRSDSLISVTASANAGDTVLIGPGTFDVDLRFNHSGTADNPIVVRGYPGIRTVLHVPAGSSSAMILSANQNITFQDIDFRGGVQLVATCRNIIFQRCVFDSSAGYGLRVVDSDATLTDSRLTDNRSGAFIQGIKEGTVSIIFENVLVARNAGNGLEMNIPKGDIKKCTISDNGGDGIYVTVPHSLLSITNSIISGNAGTGIFRQRDTEFQDRFEPQQCDVWGNKVDDWSLQGMDTTLAADLLKANFSIQPEFVDPANLGYGLQPGSTLAEFEHQAGSLVVGYRP